MLADGVLQHLALSRGGANADAGSFSASRGFGFGFEAGPGPGRDPRVVDGARRATGAIGVDARAATPRRRRGGRTRGELEPIGGGHPAVGVAGVLGGAARGARRRRSRPVGVKRCFARYSPPYSDREVEDTPPPTPKFAGICTRRCCRFAIRQTTEVRAVTSLRARVGANRGAVGEGDAGATGADADVDPSRVAAARAAADAAAAAAAAQDELEAARRR